MKYLLLSLCLFFLSCKTNKKSAEQSVQVVYDACEMDKISDLKNAIIFFGIEDEEPSEKVLGILISDSFKQALKEKNIKLVVVDELCLFGEALITEHKIFGFPTVLKIEENGEAGEKLIGITSVSTLRQRFLEKM